MRRGRSFLGLVVLLGGAVLAGGCEEWLPLGSEGEKLWKRHCSECHGFNGGGTLKYNQNRSINLLDDFWNNGGTDGEIRGVILEGVFPSMPAYDGELTRDEVKEVVRYLREELRSEVD